MTKKSTLRKHNRRYDSRRREILRSAAAVFSRKGFSGATMEEISEGLNLTKGSLYYYFGSKQDLLYFCQRHSLRRLLEEAERIAASPEPVPAQLYQMIVSQIRTMLEELLGSVAHTEVRDLPETRLREIIEQRDRYERALRRLVSRGMSEGVFYRGDVRARVWAILGAINWTVQWYSPAGPLTAEEIGHEFAAFLLRGLTRPEHHAQIPAPGELAAFSVPGTESAAVER